MGSSKVIRKLAEGEMFDAGTVDAKTDSNTGVTRINGKAVSDGQEGWITLKGNAGTVFAEVLPKYYSVLKQVALNKSDSSSSPLRTLEPGEALQVVEGPKEETATPQMRIKVRAVADKAIGWVTKAQMKNWSPHYKVWSPTPLEDTRGATKITKTIRDLVKGEIIDCIEGPVEEGKELRMKGKAK